MDYDRAGRQEDLVDDAEVSAPGRVEALQLTPQRFSGAARVHRDRLEDGGENRVPYLRLQPREVPARFGRGFDEVRLFYGVRSRRDV